MKDLFSGSLGRLNNHGGARMYTTPHTIGVQPEYKVETDIPSVVEFVTCTLDGRIWVYRRSRRYYIAVFRWGKEKEEDEEEKLLFVSTIVLSNETVIKRGVDWILTDKSLMLSSDSEPYISRSEYESDDTTYIDKINQSFSFSPELEKWSELQKIYIQNAPSEELQILELKKNIFNAPSYINENGMKFFSKDSFNKIFHHGTSNWGKNMLHMGRLYLLPYVFYQDGSIKFVTAYVTNDYTREYTINNMGQYRPNLSFDKNDGWNNFLIAPFNQELMCFFTPESDDSIFCKKAENGQIIKLPKNEKFEHEHFNFSENNGAIFFDVFTHSNILLNNHGVFLLYDNLSYESKGLQQWIAPTKKIEYVSPQIVISSFDNASLITHINQAFYRDFLASKNHLFSPQLYSGKNLFLRATNIKNVKSIFVNQIDAIQSVKHNTIDWNDVYRPIVSIQKIYEANFDDMDIPIDIFYETILELILAQSGVSGEYSLRTFRNGIAKTSEWVFSDYFADINTVMSIDLTQDHVEGENEEIQGIYCVHFYFDRYDKTKLPGYYFFYDTCSMITFRVVSETRGSYRPICTYDDTSSYIQQTDTRTLALRSIHVLVDYSNDKTSIKAFKTEINPSFMSKLYPY